MGENAEDLASNQKSRRNVTIEISNLTGQYCLIDPKVYLESGCCHSAPQPTVRPDKTEVCNFTKHGGKFSGAVGVLTYDVVKRGNKEFKEKLSIMFSVPYDYNFYQNWAAVGFFDQDHPTDEKLYEDMYNKKEMAKFIRKEADGSNITFQGGSLDVMCTMSPLGRAIMKVEVWEKFFHQPEQTAAW